MRNFPAAKQLQPGPRSPVRNFLFCALLGCSLLTLSMVAPPPSKAAPVEPSPSPAAQPSDAQSAAGYARDPAALLDAYRHVEVASVSDAIEQLLGRRNYLSHRFQPLFNTRFTGFAVTVRMEKQENHDAHAVDGMLQAIDRGAEHSVYVMSIEDGADMAGMGGLMGTAMQARDFSGAVIDGAVRDTAYLRKIGFPVYATGIAPSTLVGHYKCAGTNIPVVIDGVTIDPGDIISADPDGVVIVPRASALQVLKLAQQLDFKEHSMYPLIERSKSIEDAVRQFGRL
jgi:regulator of RNase E activity RraA